MAFKRLANFDFETTMLCLFRREQLGKIAAQMDPQGEEIGNDNHPPETSLRCLSNSRAEIGLRQFEERGAHVAVGAHFLNLARQGAHPAVGLFHAASVGEEYNSRPLVFGFHPKFFRQHLLYSGRHEPNRDGCTCTVALTRDLGLGVSRHSVGTALAAALGSFSGWQEEACGAEHAHIFLEPGGK